MCTCTHSPATCNMPHVAWPDCKPWIRPSSELGLQMRRLGFSSDAALGRRWAPTPYSARQHTLQASVQPRPRPPQSCALLCVRSMTATGAPVRLCSRSTTFTGAAATTVHGGAHDRSGIRSHADPAGSCLEVRAQVAAEVSLNCKVCARRGRGERRPGVPHPAALQGEPSQRRPPGLALHI